MSRMLIYLVIQMKMFSICYFTMDRSLFFEKYSASSVRLYHRYRIETKVSLYLCLRYCLDDPRCLAINYNETSSTCELNDENCFFQDHTKEEETGWDIYNALKGNVDTRIILTHCNRIDLFNFVDWTSSFSKC